MRNTKSIILLSFISSLFSQPPGEIIDQTTIDIANYWNSSTFCQLNTKIMLESVLYLKRKNNKKIFEG